MKTKKRTAKRATKSRRLTRKGFIELLKRSGACDGAVNWVEKRTGKKRPAQIYAACTDESWLEWLVERATGDYLSWTVLCEEYPALKSLTTAVSAMTDAYCYETPDRASIRKMAAAMEKAQDRYFTQIVRNKYPWSALEPELIRELDRMRKEGEGDDDL